MEPYSSKYSKDHSASAQVDYAPRKFIPQANTGSIFDRAVPEGSKAPNFTGDLNIEGTLYRIAGWASMNNGQLRIKLKASRPDDNQKAQK